MGVVGLKVLTHNYPVFHSESVIHNCVCVVHGPVVHGDGLLMLVMSVAMFSLSFQ